LAAVRAAKCARSRGVFGRRVVFPVTIVRAQDCRAGTQAVLWRVEVGGVAARAAGDPGCAHRERAGVEDAERRGLSRPRAAAQAMPQRSGANRNLDKSSSCFFRPGDGSTPKGRALPCQCKSRRRESAASRPASHPSPASLARRGQIHQRRPRTLNAWIARANPLSAKGPRCSARIRLSTPLKVFCSVRIWPPFASPQRREARLVTLPIAA